LALTLASSFMPDSMAVTSAKALAVEPNWKPPEPPYFLSRA